jgi:O-antigen ligase
MKQHPLLNTVKARCEAMPEPFMASLSLGLLLSLLTYLVLPWLGIRLFANLLSFNNVVSLITLLAGGTAYICYYQYVSRRPETLMYFVVVAWPIVEYANMYLLNILGINLHLRPLLILILVVPGILYGIQNSKVLWSSIPHLKYYLGFWIVMLIYNFFFNSHAVDPRFGQDNVMSEGSVGVVQFTSYTFCLVSIVIAGTSVFKGQNPGAFFDRLNTAILWVSSILALITTIGYPFWLFSTNLDGFHRAMGIFTHPNPFAHHMGILMIYLLGIFCFYQGRNKNRISQWLLIMGLLLNSLAFLLGLSKTAIAVFAVSALLLFMLNLSSPEIRKNFLGGLVALVVVGGIGLFAYQMITETSFFDILQSRIDQQQSMNWRMEIWQILLANIDSSSFFLGHGFTAANQLVFQFSFNDRSNSHPLMMVHNGYIALLYDIGILGYLMFLAVLVMLASAFKRFMMPLQQMNRPMMATIAALSLYFLITCGFDEMTYMFDAPVLFWTFSTLLFCMAQREVVA